MKFKTRFDLPFIIVFSLVIVLFAVLPFLFIFLGGGYLWYWSFLMFFILAFILTLIFSISYELTETELIIHVFFIKSRIKYTDMRGVQRKRSLMASTATSVQRLVFYTNRGPAFAEAVSPKDEKLFLETLKIKLEIAGNNSFKLPEIL